MESEELLMWVGGALVLAGVLRTRSGKIPWLTRFPGDLIPQRETVTIYASVTTCVGLRRLISPFVFFLRRWR